MTIGFCPLQGPCTKGNSSKLLFPLILAVWLFQAPVASGEPTAPNTFATVWRLHGDVTATTSAGGTPRTLHEGDRVAVAERIHAASTAEAVLKTADAGLVAIRPNADMIVENYSAVGNANDNLTLRIFTGSLRIITGWMSQTHRAGIKVVTPTVTIGVRGTDHEPYVLPAELAAGTTYREGTYDKVNRGGTQMAVGEHTLDIDAGKVGFARAAGKPPGTRALMSLLLPVLLDKVPDFYVAGQFDGEMDQYSANAEDTSIKALKEKQERVTSTAASDCKPDKIAKAWLSKLDKAIARRDGAAILAGFAPDVRIRASVKNADGSASNLEISRDEFVASTLTAMGELKNFKQRRISIEATMSNSSPNDCHQIRASSLVVEQGVMGKKPYRLESKENYLLEFRSGSWLATEAETVQQ